MKKDTLKTRLLKLASKRMALWFCVVSLFVNLGQSTFANTQAANKVDQIKVAYLVNFMRLTTWKNLQANSQTPPFTITVISGKDFIQAMQPAFKDGKFNDRKVVIHHLPSEAFKKATLDQAAQDLLSDSHLIYMHDAGLAELQTFQRSNIKPDHLLVGDMPEFAEHGGMIGLRQEQSGIRFTVNLKEIRQSSIHVSSKLLRLGVKVRGKD
ncbi:MAG: YfiR family protein [Phycisphaeraceae bacterium JB051]